jgi:hypothetical protein
MKKLLTIMWYCCAALLLSGLAATAQTITGTIRGTVTDPSSAVVAGAKITATNVATGITTATTTDRSGLYNIQFLPIGEYTISATAKGFSITSIGPFHLQIDQIAKVDAKLQIGQATVRIDVRASSSPILNVENSTLGTTISSNTLQNMPMNGQNVNFASMFVPGAVDPTAGAMGGQMGTERDTGIVGGQGAEATPSFSGNRQQANNYVLDGIEINETLNNLIGYNPSPFSIQEMRVITGNADAEYGNVAGGEVVMVTKSGTNKFHGNAWEYFENDGLAANTWAQNHSHAKKQSFTQNQYGGAVGGPIFKNKIFFFVDYSGTYHSIPPSQQVDSVPDAKMRSGDFSEVLAVEGVQLYNNSAGTGNATPYVNNQVPITNPVAKYLFNISNHGSLPMPNNTANVFPGTVTSGNYIGTTSSHQANNQGDIRVDYTINAGNSLMGKFTIGDAYDATTQNALPTNFPMGDDYPFKSTMLSWVHTFSSALVNEARGGYSRIIWHQSIPLDPSGAYGNTGDKVVGIGYPFPAQPVVGFTYMAIGGIANCSSSDDWSCHLGTSTNADNKVNDVNLDFGDNLTWVHGNQIIKFGAQFVQYQQSFMTLSNLGGPLGAFGYNGNYTADYTSAATGNWPFADFVTDQSNQGQIAGVTSPFSQRQWRDAYYVQDDWKIRHNLTLNLGLRYGYDQPIYEVNNRMSSVNLPLAAFAPFSDYAVNTSNPSWFELAGKNGNSRALYNPVYTEFMPRFGFALQINRRAVLRGGYGVTDEMEGTGTGLRMTQNPPFQTAFNQTAQAPTATSGGAPFNVGTGFASVAAGGNQNASIQQGSQFDVWDPNFRPAVIQQFNLTTQFMIDNQTSVSVGYVGELGQHLAVPMGVNQYTNLVPATCPTVGPNGGCAHVVDPYDSVVGPYGFIIETQSNGIENYNGMQAILQRQEANGLEYQLNYTWAKSMTDNAGYFGVDGSDQPDPLPQDAYNLMGDYGPSGTDVRHNLTGTMVYQLPFGHQKKFGANWNRLTDEALGGWELSGDAMLFSGLPVTMITFSPTGLTNSAQENDDGVERANQYTHMKIVNRSTAHWFGTDPSAVPCKNSGTQTNALGANCAYGLPGGPTLADQFGNARVGTERAPGFRQVDLSLFKAFQTYKGQNVKLRVDAFNVFNLASYGPPRNNISSSSFGAIMNTLSPPRQIQFSVVYQF